MDFVLVVLMFDYMPCSNEYVCAHIVVCLLSCLSFHIGYIFLLLQSMIELSRTQDEEVGDGTTSVIVLGMALFNFFALGGWILSVKLLSWNSLTHSLFILGI